MALTWAGKVCMLNILKHELGKFYFIDMSMGKKSACLVKYHYFE